MDEDPAAKSNSVLEMLRKVPMVTVDAEENVKVQGSSNFKILVNGKEDPMFSGSSLSTVLKAMPASSIRKIEVITEPGAKYDAEGTSGVLNIVTTGRQQLEGVFGNVNAWLNRQVPEPAPTPVQRSKTWPQASTHGTIKPEFSP